MRLTAEQFMQILARLKSDAANGHHNEKRASPRVGMRMQVVVVPCLQDRPPARHVVWVRDLSYDGIGLLHREEIPRGTYFLALFNRGRGSTLTALYRVAYCARQADRQYTIGGKLDRIIDANANTTDTAA